MVLNKKYIEQLAKGEIALDNSVRNLELLRRILKEAFPKSVTAAGGDNYYYKFGSKWLSSLNKAYIKDLPTIKLEDFLIKELPKDNFGIIVENGNGRDILNWFKEHHYDCNVQNGTGIDNEAYYTETNNKVLHTCRPYERKSIINQLFTLGEIKQLEQNMEKLPENWHVLVTKENQNILRKWRFNNDYSNLSVGYIVGLTKNNKGYIEKGHNPHFNIVDKFSTGYDFGKEISFETFKRLVLKENMENTQNKKIIGYIAPIDLFGGVIKKGTLFKFRSKSSLNGSFYCPETHTNGDYDLPKEIVETWTPQYSTTFKSGDYIVAEGSIGGLQKVRKLTSSRIQEDRLYWTEEGTTCEHNWNLDKIRLATPEEIKAATIQLPKINGYSGKLEGDYIIYGNNCAKFHKDFFRMIYDASNLNQKEGNRIVRKIELNTNVSVTFEQIEQIVKYIDNQ